MKTNLLHSTSVNEMQSYAMAARALRGDTIYHRYPYIETPSGARLGSYVEDKREIRPLEKSFEIFPNPNNGEFTLQLSGYEDGTYAIDVLDLTGRVIQSSTSTVKGNSCIRRIQLRDVSYGMYFCRVSSVNSSTVAVKRIIITK